MFNVNVAQVDGFFAPPKRTRLRSLCHVWNEQEVNAHHTMPLEGSSDAASLKSLDSLPLPLGYPWKSFLYLPL